MKTASGLTLIAVGAVLAFAVNGHPWFLNLQIVGWILMIIGVIGMVIPRRGYGWLRRQMVVRRTAEAPPAIGVREKRYPPYIMINPAAAGVAGPTTEATTAQMPEMPTNSEAQSWSEADATIVPDKETVEEFFEE